jgi:MFS family permease
MPRSLWLLVIGMIINVTGSSFLWPLNTIYIHDHLGKSLSVAGLVLMFNSAASVVGNLFGGALFDKVGGYKSILTGIIISLMAVIGLVINNEWPYYVVFLTIVGFGSGIVFPAMYAMAGSVWPEGGRRAFNAVYVAQNVGVAVGAGLGGLVASYSFTYIFMANAVLILVYFFIALFGYRRISIEKAEQSSILEQPQVVKSRTKLTALLVMTIGYLICWLAYVQWQTTIASHTQDLGISLKQYSLLWTINGALIVLGQPIISLVVRKFARTLKTQIIVGLIIFIGSFAIVTKAEQFTAFVVAMIILTIGEMFVWPAVPTIANELAPKGREGFYQGIVNSTATGGRMLGPIFGGIIVDLYNIELLFILLIMLLIVSIIPTALYDQKIKKKSQDNPIVISSQT